MAGIVDLPTTLDSQDYLRMLVTGVTLRVSPPRQMITNGRAFAQKRGGVNKRIVQNIGTAAIYFWIQTDAPVDYSGDPDVSPPHGVITPDTGDKAGYGGQVDFSNYENPIWLGNSSGNFKALILEAFSDNIRAGVDELV